MVRFNTVEDVKKAFQARSNGADMVDYHSGFRFSDIDKYAPIIEKLLDTDYNKVSGFNFSEIAEAISGIQTNYGSNHYAQAWRQNGNSIDESMLVNNKTDYFNEAFEGTTVAQAPYPVPSLALTMWAYEKSVLPFLAHLFDLKGNRGLVYFQRIEATNSKGNITAGQLLGSPKEMGKQPVGFIGTKGVEEVANFTSGGATYTKVINGGKSVQPGTLIVTIDGDAGYFMDIATSSDMKTGAVGLISVNGNLGTATFDFSTSTLTVKPTGSVAEANAKIRCTYTREVETSQGGTDNQAKLTMKLESKQLVAENFSVETETNLYQEALSKAIFGMDWNAEVDNSLGMLYNKEVANKIYSEINAKIGANSSSTHSVAPSAHTGDNALFSVQFISVVLGKLRKLIARESGIAADTLSAMVISVDVLPIFEALPKFKKATNNFEETMGGMSLVGLYDGIPVIMGYDPIVAAGAVTGLYKSKTKDFLTPYVFGTFIPPVIRDIYDQNNLAVNKKQLIASAAGEVVAEKLAAKITINDIDTII